MGAQVNFIIIFFFNYDLLENRANDLVMATWTAAVHASLKAVAARKRHSAASRCETLLLCSV